MSEHICGWRLPSGRSIKRSDCARCSDQPKTPAVPPAPPAPSIDTSLAAF